MQRKLDRKQGTMRKRHTLSDAAKKLGLTRQGLYYWIRKGWVTPKRDYRNFPVFTDDDLSKIMEWKSRLR